MGKWKRGGVIVVQYITDHQPRHVHIYEDGKRQVKFDIDNWVPMEGTLTPKIKRALESLNREGVFDEKPTV